MAAWNADTLARTAGIGAVTIVFGSSFCVSGPGGDIDGNRPQGYFFRDTRLVSEWDLTVNGLPVEPLSSMTPQPYRAVFVGRAGHAPGRADSPLVVQRERRVGTGLREDITLKNFSRQDIDCHVQLALDADFADIFEVKEGRVEHKGEHASIHQGDRLLIDSVQGSEGRGFVVHAPDAQIDRDRLTYQITIPAHGSWTTTVQVIPTINHQEVESSFPIDQPLRESEPAKRFLAWHSHIPTASLEDDAVEDVIDRSQKDIGSLRIFDPEHPDRAVVAAGAPWFMALFGRDSLLTSMMALPVDPSLALGTLQTLASLQGEKVDRLTEEQPGRILHEVRLGSDAGLALGGGNVYYGTADATPLFVDLLGELSRWGLSPESLAALLPNADRALDWARDYGDRDGDGFIEYQRLNDHGLINQGWKDSWDGINFADGTLAEPPIALCEVQGYLYRAYVSRGLLAKSLENGENADMWLKKAADLKAEFNERFWLPNRGYFAIALDKDKRAVDSCASNMGHCLWSGIVDDDKAPSVAEHLMSPRMFTGWGVRTLASDMGAYNPASYHNGSVWPHDNAIIAAGLMRYGFVEEARRIAFGLFEAADIFDDRLPELFCGFDRSEYVEPVSYPNSCSPQAWAAASPLYLIRTLLRFDPSVPTREVWLDPALPDDFGDLRVENLPLAGSRLTIEVENDKTTVTGLPENMTLHREARPVHADLARLSR